MWTPKYTISHHLLRSVRDIGETMGAIKNSHASPEMTAHLRDAARAVSTHASTSIEGNPLRLTDVKRLLKQAPANLRDTEREILNYDRALSWLQNEVSAKALVWSSATFETVQGMVVEGLMDNPAHVGRLRQAPVIIRDPTDPDPEAIVFLPPDSNDVPTLCRDLFAFVEANIGRLDPVLLAGLFHKQAVLIHPFMDGNGRATRLLTSAILGASGLDVWSVCSFEAYYNRNVTRYFDRVGEFGDWYDLDADGGADFTQWLNYFADGILDELQRVRSELTSPRLTPRLSEHLRAALEFVDQNGEITQRDYGRLTERSLASRKKDLAHLVDSGLLRREGGGRSVRYVRVNSRQSE